MNSFFTIHLVAPDPESSRMTTDAEKIYFLGMCNSNIPQLLCVLFFFLNISCRLLLGCVCLYFISFVIILKYIYSDCSNECCIEQDIRGKP